jgi:hypothetical protein
MTLRHATGAVLCLLVLGSATACGSDDGTASSGPSSGPSSGSSAASPPSPAVCHDAEALTASVEKLTSMKVGQTSASELTNELRVLQQTLTQLAADASSTYAPQIDAAKSAATALETGLHAAVASPSPETLKATRQDAAALGAAVRKLHDAVASTC